MTARILALIGCTFALVACTGDVLNTKPEVKGLEGAAPVQTLTDPASGTDVTLRPGGVLVLRVQSNPTTGYYWGLVAGDEAVVRATANDYVADPAPEGMVGGGGTQILTFEGVSAGRTVLKLSYERSPEDVAEQLSIKVKVTG